MIVKLLTEHHFEFLSLKGGCRGSSESTLVKMSNCWKSHAKPHISLLNFLQVSEERDKLSLQTKPPLLVKIAPDLSQQDKQDITDVLLKKQVIGLFCCNSLNQEYKHLHIYLTAKETHIIQ